jgi:hypothetical protein
VAPASDNSAWGARVEQLELMGFSELEPSQSIPGANAVPLGLSDTPAKRRLLRRLARLDSPRIKVLARLVAFLLPEGNPQE